MRLTTTILEATLKAGFPSYRWRVGRELATDQIHIVCWSRTSATPWAHATKMIDGQEAALIEQLTPQDAADWLSMHAQDLITTLEVGPS